MFGFIYMCVRTNGIGNGDTGHTGPTGCCKRFHLYWKLKILWPLLFGIGVSLIEMRWWAATSDVRLIQK